MSQIVTKGLKITTLFITTLVAYKDMKMTLQLLLLLATIVLQIEGHPGVPGLEWSSEVIKITQYRLRKFWSFPLQNTKKFDPKNNAIYPEYVYDPTNITIEPNCDFEADRNCQNWWGNYNRGQDIAFNERKMLRLAFHDCVPYQDGSGGCDGCLNLDDNLEDNNGLQYIVAVLEKMYTDKEYMVPPRMSGKLDKSLKDMGISRADLWAFAGLVALDEFQIKTRGYCHFQSKWNLSFTCGDENHTCFSPFPIVNLATMFKTGRKDCEPSPKADDFTQYLASKTEVHPDQNDGGLKTNAYFKQHFNLEPRQGLALLGIHTVGQFNPMTSKLDYAWVRDEDFSLRPLLFNHEYFRILAQKPAKIKDEACTGTVDGKPASVSFNPWINSFPKTFGQLKPYTSNGKPGHVSWRVSYLRGPTCNATINPLGDKHASLSEDSDNFFGPEKAKDLGDLAKEAGYQSGYQWCCHQIQNDLSNVHPKCTRSVQGRLRFTTAEIGYVYDISHNEDGLPQGCSNFNDNMNYEDKADLKEAECGKSLIKDLGYTGKSIRKVVRLYAKSNDAWLQDLLPAYDKMITNGNDNLQVDKNKLFWAHICCFHSTIEYGDEPYKTVQIYMFNAVKCQELCQSSEHQDCVGFVYDENSNKCSLYQTMDTPKLVDHKGYILTKRNIVSGPKVCPEAANKCSSYDF